MESYIVVAIVVVMFIVYHFFINKTVANGHDLRDLKESYEKRITQLEKYYTDKIHKMQEQIDYLLEKLTEQNKKLATLSNLNHKVLLVCSDIQRFCSTDSRMLRKAEVDFYTLENATGEMIHKEIQRASVDNEKYTAIQIAAHGDETGIQLYDKLYSSEELEEILIGIDLLFLSACKSHYVSDKLIGTNRTIITMRHDISDDDAENFAYIFWREYKNGNSAKESYETARNTVQNIKDKVGIRVQNKP